jgi:hypothetical protein
MEAQLKASDETLRMAYAEVCKSYQAVRETQLKLLAILPVIMGVAVSLLFNQDKKDFSAFHYYVVGGLGAAFTIGLYLHGLRADQHATALCKHGALLEKELHFPVGQFKDRPSLRLRFLGYTLSFTLIYLALLVAWVCLIYVRMASKLRTHKNPLPGARDSEVLKLVREMVFAGAW